MAATPNFQLGRAMTSLVITPQAIASDGTFSDTTPVATVTGVLSEFDYTSENELEEISAVTSRRKNNMPIASGTSASIEVIMKAGTDTAFAVNALGGIAYGSTDFAKVVLSQYGLTWGPYYAVIKTWNHGIKGKGKVLGRLELDMVDPGTANPAVS